jgi:predicted phage gp36 major capsid-like protein
MQREGVFREMKRRKAYEKPSERKTREKAEAVRRARKAARKQAQREGLIPMPKRLAAAAFSRTNLASCFGIFSRNSYVQSGSASPLSRSIVRAVLVVSASALAGRGST